MLQEDLTKAIEERTKEIYAYQANIDNYTTAIGLITDVWDDKTKFYKNYSNEQIIDLVPEALQDKVSQLVYKDRLTRLLKSEKMEQAKAQTMLDALKLQVGE